MRDSKTPRSGGSKLDPMGGASSSAHDGLTSPIERCWGRRWPGLVAMTGRATTTREAYPTREVATSRTRREVGRRRSAPVPSSLAGWWRASRRSSATRLAGESACRPRELFNGCSGLLASTSEAIGQRGGIGAAHLVVRLLKLRVVRINGPEDCIGCLFQLVGSAEPDQRHSDPGAIVTEVVIGDDGMNLFFLRCPAALPLGLPGDVVQ